VVKEIVTAGGSTMAPERNALGKRVMQESVRNQIVPILASVVDEGTGVAIALPGYPIAGKTGTAQKFDLATGRYSQTANVSTFVGFVPADEPAFVAAVMLDEPRGITLGGWTAGPVFRAVASAALTAYGVAPDEDVRDAQLASAEKASKSGDASRAWQAMYRRGAKAAAVREVDVPNVKGLTQEAARLALAKAGLKMKASGRGRVAAQFPGPGTDVLENSTVSLSLEGSPAPAGKAAKDKGLLSRFF
jgi:membrane peptidoglycan carboxypeptidase